MAVTGAAEFPVPVAIVVAVTELCPSMDAFSFLDRLEDDTALDVTAEEAELVLLLLFLGVLCGGC